jgi:ubiquinone/menaquinone biosynthesis C-methylase UbiE
MKQSEVFLLSEGDGFYRRNHKDLAEMARQGEDDPVMKGLRALSLSPRRILEVGCSNGWRLALMNGAFGAQCFGLDPSSEAVAQGRAKHSQITLTTGTAESLPYENDAFDLVVFGFCLYLCDRQDMFRIAAEADRVLADTGFLAILDFYPPFPYRNRYHHCDGLYSYKMDYGQMFLWNPAYQLATKSVFQVGRGGLAPPDERLALVVLQKDMQHAFLNSPYSAGGSD